MNRHFAIALVIATAAAGNAFADDITIDPTPFTSSLSRAQVQADLQQFRQSGSDPWSQSYDQLAGFQSERSRADARAEFIAARDSVAAQGAEHGGAMILAHGAPAPVARIAAR